MIPLIPAVLAEHYDAVALVLGRSDVNVNVQDNLGRTPLMDAAAHGYAEVVRMVMMCDKVNVNARCKREISALDISADEGNEDAFALALRRGAIKVNDKDDNVGLAPLMHAAIQCYSKVMRTPMGCYDEDVDTSSKTGCIH